MITEAIDCYHSLLTDEIAVHTHAVMQAQAQQRRLHFGNVPLCRVLRPHFYTKPDWAYLQQRTALILSAFAKAHAACMEDADLRAQLDLEPYEEEMLWVDVDAGIKVPWSSSRLDAFFRPETSYLRFVEYNAETPAGIGYGDELMSMFLELEPMHLFKQYYHVYDNYGMPQLLDVLLRAYKAWGGQGYPQIAIVDWSEVPTLNEHEISRVFFERDGYKAVLCDPRILEYRDGRLWAGDFQVDMIYKRVLCSELVHRLGLHTPLIQAIRDRNVFITNSFSAKLMAKKASLAFLSDDANGNLFTPEEHGAIAEHIPWTRRVQDRRTMYERAEIELIPFIAEHQERFVLKPNDEYGGHGVVLGWEVSAEVWQATIQTALTTPHVVQERVTLVQRDFPAVMDDKLDISSRYVDANPYVFYGENIGGCLTRLSSAALLNVTAGSGSVVPMFVIEKK